MKVTLVTLLASILFVSLSDCQDQYIVGGNSTTIETYPYQVAALWDGLFLCGGSVLSPEWILTAKHCLGIITQIRLGSTYANKGGLVIDIVEKVAHESFDIALVKLARKVNFTKSIQPISLWKPNDTIADGTDAIVTGWGSHVPIMSRAPSDGNILQVVTVQIVNYQKCKNAYKDELKKSEICAAAPGKDSCHGDSGGPMVINGKQVGVVSFGKGCARPEYPGVYAGVPAAYDFIRKVARLSQ